MVGIKDIEKIIISDLSSLMSVSSIYTEDDIPEGAVTEERITVHSKELIPETYFKKCFVEVNWCVPDLEDRPNSRRLDEVEAELVSFLDLAPVGVYGGQAYRYGINSHQIRKSELDCHYVNVRLLFEILNVK